MQVSFEVTAELRTLQGKSASRRLRRDGKLPAILYGAGQAPVCLQLHHNKMVLQSEHEAFYSHILTLKMPDGTDEKVILKAMQRHPVRPIILHMDFLRINENEELTMRVPLHFLNQDICPAVKSGGGTVIHYAGEVMLSCLPKDLPEYISVDLLTLGLGQTLHFSDLVLPAGVRIAPLAAGGDASLPVIMIQAPRVVEEAPTAAAAKGAKGKPAAKAAPKPAAKPPAKPASKK